MNEAFVTTTSKTRTLVFHPLVQSDLCRLDRTKVFSVVSFVSAAHIVAADGMLRRVGSRLLRPKGLVARLKPVNRTYHHKRAPFTDAVKILVSSGGGGDGAINLHHESNREFAGPSGGNGGRGGNVVLKCSRRHGDLAHIAAFGSFIKADSGLNGGAVKCTGKSGSDLVLEVPPGTQVTDVDTNDVCYDLETEGQEVVLLEGGKGGKGNAMFKSAVNQLPLNATRGLPGNTMLTMFELKSIADVGLVGFPNAGKSSLLAALSTCTPKIAAYPFTTLHPLIGRLQDMLGNTCSIADLPGLIEGSYENRGLGHRFLRHVERSRMLVYVLDMHAPYVPVATDTSTAAARRFAERVPPPWEVLQVLQDELEFYQPGLAQRGTVVLANKMDHETDAAGRPTKETFAELQRRVGRRMACFPVSAAVGIADGPGEASGLPPAVHAICKKVFAMRRDDAKAKAAEKAAVEAEMATKFSIVGDAFSPQASPPPDDGQRVDFMLRVGALGEDLRYGLRRPARRHGGTGAPSASPTGRRDSDDAALEAAEAELGVARAGRPSSAPPSYRPRHSSLVDAQLDGATGLAEDFSPFHNLPRDASPERWQDVGMTRTEAWKIPR